MNLTSFQNSVFAKGTRPRHVLERKNTETSLFGTALGSNHFFQKFVKISIHLCSVNFFSWILAFDLCSLWVLVSNKQNKEIYHVCLLDTRLDGREKGKMRNGRSVKWGCRLLRYRFSSALFRRSVLLLKKIYQVHLIRWSCKCPFAGKALTGNDTVNFDPAPEFSNPAQLFNSAFLTPGKPSLQIAQDALTSLVTFWILC